MEDALDLYVEPDDARRPQVCFDESPVQLVSETRQPLPLEPGRTVCYDYEYKREGTANLFLFVQPLMGWRQVNVTARRTRQDFAEQMKLLVDVYLPEAERIRLVVDNLNTHTPAALYAAFEPAEARRLTRKLEFHYTPKPGRRAQYGRMRVRGPRQAMPGSPHPRHRNPVPGNCRLAGPAQQRQDQNQLVL